MLLGVSLEAGVFVRVRVSLLPVLNVVWKESTFAAPGAFACLEAFFELGAFWEAGAFLRVGSFALVLLFVACALVGVVCVAIAAGAFPVLASRDSSSSAGSEASVWPRSFSLGIL